MLFRDVHIWLFLSVYSRMSTSTGTYTASTSTCTIITLPPHVLFSRPLDVWRIDNLHLLFT